MQRKKCISCIKNVYIILDFDTITKQYLGVATMKILDLER